MSINKPFSLISSTFALAASQIAGASCHSSIILGFSPIKTDERFKLANCLFAKLLYDHLLKIHF
ncbi:hypothetical protein [Mycoplasmopsis agalactiae]|uniref:hypothetical protein n=1 Tax=Mycoplasmopsis agalactiae TaxID=2110 RepID=UPI001F2CF4C1|nr:hypothetical protein [Mycoplasmopsis agalactiae]